MHPHLTPRKYILRLIHKIRNTPNIFIVIKENITYNYHVCIADLSVLCGSWITIPCQIRRQPYLVVHRMSLNFSMNILPYTFS